MMTYKCKALLLTAVGVAAGALAAATSCIIEDNSVDEKVVATASAAEFDLLGNSAVSQNAALDLRSSMRVVSGAMTIQTGPAGFITFIY